MRTALTLLALALLGLFGATSIGYASYVVSRDSVGLPVTKLKLSPERLSPTAAQRKAAEAARKARAATTARTRTAVTPPPPPSPRTTTDDDNSGKGSGGSDDDSGKGRGRGRGGDDDD